MSSEPAKSSPHAQGYSPALAPAVSDPVVASAWMLVAAIAALTIHQRGWSPINHDVAWVLQGSLRMLDGAVFGRDIVDVNPPLAWWLGMPPAWFSRATGVAPGLSFVLFMTALVLVSLAIANRVLVIAGLGSWFRAFMLAGGAAVLLIAPGYDFGQREHVMTVAVLPYVLSASFWSTGVRTSPRLGSTVGLISAAGLCLKPHFLLIPVCLEVLVAIGRRSLPATIRWETAAIALFALGYVAAVWLLAPAYLNTVVPEAASTYWAYGNSLADTARRAWQALWLPGLIAAAAGLVAWRLGAMSLGLLISATAALAAALLQMKGWPYHLYPAIALLSLAALSMAAPSAGGRMVLPRAVLAAVALGATFPAAVREAASVTRHDARPTVVSELASTFQRYAGPNGSVFAFITSPRNIHPAVLKADVRWASTACCLHLLPAAVRAPEDAAGVAAAERQLARILDDLRRERPAVIAVDTARYKLGFAGEQFDYLAFLNARPEFARLLSEYSERERIGSYRILVRSELLPGPVPEWE